ncbi:hypothetical protein B0H13DRAFT_2531021 [Mycena leptocephala]|nr:hypothetical protein B0H13DRAFT_2531021 [Mycena leptocephala]
MQQRSKDLLVIRPIKAGEKLGGPPEIEGTGSTGPGTGPGEAGSNGGTGGPQSNDSSIDPSLIAAPPPKKPRNSSGPRHRKIVAEDPMGTIKDHITATMLANFVNKWLENATEVEATEGTRTADRFIDLRDSAVDIMEHVAEVAEQYGFSDEQLQWEIQYDGGAVNISHLTSLYDWLVATGVMIGNIQMKPAVKKAGQSAHTVKIIDDGKTVTMTPARLTQARTNPSAFPGCVEVGLETIVEVLKNRNGNSKCFSCNISGLIIHFWTAVNAPSTAQPSSYG